LIDSILPLKVIENAYVQNTLTSNNFEGRGWLDAKKNSLINRHTKNLKDVALFCYSLNYHNREGDINEYISLSHNNFSRGEAASKT